MPNPYFQFKQFTVYHDRCAMKVGTDGVLLGAWAPLGSEVKRILDIGTGSGLIALMLAQRCPTARVLGIDVDAAAVGQAQDNFKASPWADRLNAIHTPVQLLCGAVDGGRFDLIVSNPPFFVNSLPNPQQERAVARHTFSLSHDDLLRAATWLLAPEGAFALILPVNEGEVFAEKARAEGLSLTHKTVVYPTPQAQPKRLLLCFTHQSGTAVCTETDLVIEAAGRHAYSEEYRCLTGDFYL